MCETENTLGKINTGFDTAEELVNLNIAIATI